uniref:Uncharacterized protein n=1 Tax=Oryza glumipatula TaxID=40148 RepID=A0A0D9Y233_9ORYZ
MVKKEIDQWRRALEEEKVERMRERICRALVGEHPQRECAGLGAGSVVGGLGSCTHAAAWGRGRRRRRARRMRALWAVVKWVARRRRRMVWAKRRGSEAQGGGRRS